MRVSQLFSQPRSASSGQFSSPSQGSRELVVRTWFAAAFLLKIPDANTRKKVFMVRICSVTAAVGRLLNLNASLELLRTRGRF